MARYYTAEKLGPPCPVCGERVPRALTVAGFIAHPTCGPS